MKNQYQNELDRVALTEEGKRAMVLRLTQTEPSIAGRQRRPRRRVHRLLAAALAVCLLTVCVGAAVAGLPIGRVMEQFYGNSAGYQQSGAAVGASVTRKGWTLTITDCVGDDYNLYLGLELAAPEGTVLDENAYYFEKWEGSFPALWFQGGSSTSYTAVEDEDPADNLLHFILWQSYLPGGPAPNGQRYRLSLGGLHHHGEWVENENGRDGWTHISDCGETWTINTTISYPDNTIRLEPNLPVHTLDVDAVITQVDISPIGVYIQIEGDALQGHHNWVPRNAPDGWYGCIEYQEVTLYTTDGQAIPMQEGLSGSGCSGGTDASEDGWLHLARGGEDLLDLDTLDHISICGVEIPLR